MLSVRCLRMRSDARARDDTSNTIAQVGTLAHTVVASHPCVCGRYPLRGPAGSRLTVVRPSLVIANLRTIAHSDSYVHALYWHVTRSGFVSSWNARHIWEPSDTCAGLSSARPTTSPALLRVTTGLIHVVTAYCRQSLLGAIARPLTLSRSRMTS